MVARAQLACALAAALVAPAATLLRPQDSESRSARRLDGIWAVKVDAADRGRAERWWAAPLAAPVLEAPVPSTLNEVLAADPAANWTDGYFGAVWLQTEFFVPSEWAERRVALRFDAVSVNAQVWVNGAPDPVAQHGMCCLPFESAALGQQLRAGRNRLTVRVDGERSWQSMPPGKQGRNRWGQPLLFGGDAGYLYSMIGIDQPVWLVATPPEAAIEDITVVTDFEGASLSTGLVRFNVSLAALASGSDATVTVQLQDGGTEAANHSQSLRDCACGGGSCACSGTLRVPHAKAWWPIGHGSHRHPFLYTLVARVERSTAEAGAASDLLDIYRLPVGIRTLEGKGAQFLVNGEPHYFRGTDCHQVPRLVLLVAWDGLTPVAPVRTRCTAGTARTT